MPHAINRKAFLSINNPDEPLVTAYCQLVATELALKDHAAQWPSGHDLLQLLNNLNDPGLVSLGASLRTELSAVPCTTIKGDTAMVRPDRYPELRYTQHQNDYTGGATDEQLRNIVQIVEDVIKQLRYSGVTI